MYTFTWKKYLPVIRLLLKKSANEEQTVTLNRTDFEKTTKLRKPNCSFSVEVRKGRIFNPPVAARDLLEVLMQDPGAEELLRIQQYMISFNSDFQLTIKNITPDKEEDTEAEKAEEAPAEENNDETKE